MTKGRLEAFSDGVIAIIITIMVLELRVSFTFLAIYWNNHHHMLQAARHVDGRILWANVHLLFWLSLTPFVTAWVGETSFAPAPVASYGVVMLLAGCAYYLLSRLLIARHGAESPLARAVGSDLKGRISLVLYALAIAVAFPLAWAACAIYVGVAILWLVPDRRIERVLVE